MLHVFFKLLERLVYNRLIAYITNNKLLHEYQFGFQKGKSTYLDFSKAFDSVDHNVLLMKLEKYGIKA